MTLKNFELKIIWRVLLLFGVLTAAAFFLIQGWHLYFVLLLPLVSYQLFDLIQFQKKAQEDVKQFVEAIHYRDFSRYFDVKHSPSELQTLRQGFNEINTTFKIISKEKETQYQYLQKILELVDTGILSFEEESGEVVWMNESLKKMLQLPYLKTIQSLAKRDKALYEEIIAAQPGDSKIANAHL